MSKNSEIAETRNTASFATKRAKRHHLRDTVSYIFEDNGGRSEIWQTVSRAARYEAVL
jgi:hypothetical protein